ncbi:MAG: flagellar basal body rod protein FlgB [Armatimonadetes bacterium]|nr:flagellar basal body rod protein FlgB [Armatimonadota bacterium]
MRPLDGLFGPKSRNLERALGRTAQRHALLTENLANVNVPGYRRKDVDFGIELEKATDAQGGLERVRAKLGARPSTAGGEVRIDGNGVDLEKEVAGIGESELRYELLTEITGNYFSGLRNVIREGR